jgi:hypothetical protein
MNHENLGHRFSTPALQVRRSSRPHRARLAAKAASGAGPAFFSPRSSLIDRLEQASSRARHFMMHEPCQNRNSRAFVLPCRLQKPDSSPVLPLNRGQIPSWIAGSSKLSFFIKGLTARCIPGLPHAFVCSIGSCKMEHLSQNVTLFCAISDPAPLLDLAE